MATDATEPDSEGSEHSATRAISIDALLIQLATIEDVPYLRRLKEQVMSHRYRPAEGSEAFEDWRKKYCTDEYFEEQLADSNVKVLAIGSHREPAGMIVLRRLDDRLEIDDLLVIDPNHGFGTRLLWSAIAYAESWRCPLVSVDVYPGHEGADAFLRRNGFSRTGRSTNDLGQPMDRYEYSLAG